MTATGARNVKREARNVKREPRLGEPAYKQRPNHVSRFTFLVSRFSLHVSHFLERAT
jgi:hypothetical protein